MSEQRMDIFLLAAPQAGIEHAVLVANLSASFKKDPAAIEKMLSAPRTMVKADVTAEVAAKYKVLIEKSGGQCELVARTPVMATAGQEPAPVPIEGEKPIVPSLAAAAEATEATEATDATAMPSGVVVPAAAPIPAVTPVPAVAPELTAASTQATAATQAPTQAAAPAETHGTGQADSPSQVEGVGQTEISQRVEPAPLAAFEQDIVAQLQGSAGDRSDNRGSDDRAEEPASVQPHTDGQDEAEQASADHSHVTCYCVKCGTVIRVGQRHCPKCFTPVTEYQSKHKTTASLLALFLGGLGLHRLYLGQWWGVMYLVFVWTLIPIVVAVIEAVVFWLTPQKKWDAQYGRVQKSSALLAGVFVVAFLVLIGFISGIAAIGIPAYQDFNNRFKVHTARPLVQESLNKVAAYIKKTDSYPSDNPVVGLPEHIGSEIVESISLQAGAIVQVVYRLPGLKGKNTILWIPTESKGEIIWDCKKGTLPDHYRPYECRSGANAINRELEEAAAESALTQKLYSENKHVSLLVPVTWEARELLQGAAIGAAKLSDENYVVVLADPKVNFDENLTLADYSRNVQLHLAENIKNGMVQGDVEYVTIAGFPAEQFIFPGVVGGVKISYVVTLINGDTHFYRVLAWTLQTRMDANKKLLKSISESIKTY